MSKVMYKQCWITTDGEVFTIEAEAADHQKKFNRCEKIDAILNSSGILPSRMSDHEKAVIVDFLMGNWNILYNLFNEEGED